MVPGTQKDPRDRCGAQSVEERLVVRHDDRPLSLAEIKKYVIGGPGRLDDPVTRRQTQRGLGVAIPLGQEFEFREDGSWHHDIRGPQKPLEFRLEIHAELKGHEKGVRVEQDELGHRFRALKRSYMGVR